MKKTVLFLLGIFPVFVFAQNNCDIFQYRTIQIGKTEINSSQSDFGPGFVGNELWFSAFTSEEISKLKKGSDKKIFYNLFSSGTDALGNVGNSKNIQFQTISKDYHAGPVSYCENTKELFVTLSNFENPEVRNKVYRKADIRLKIIITKKVNNEWKVIYEFPFNDPKYSVGHPSVSISGDTLYFASNKPGGFGETDLYMSVRKNGSWGDPINLGDQINSKQDDMFPFLYNGKVLFFATNNKNNGQKGDLNINYSCMQNTGFGLPKPLNELNTEEDDFGLVIHKNDKTGYFTSRRSGGLGDDDIYKVTFTGEYNLELVVMDKKLYVPISNPKVSFNDNIKGEISGYIIKRSLKEGSSVLATSQIDGFQNSSVNISTSGKPYGIIRDTIWVEKVEVGQKFVLENIYYDYDKWDILPESEIELNKLLKVLNDNPSWKVKLGSHTDSRGTDSYNEILSQKRSDSALGYIIGKGISKDRITAKGYGETQLVNECTNGVECPDEVHRKNRRTEFVLVEIEVK